MAAAMHAAVPCITRFAGNGKLQVINQVLGMQTSSGGASQQVRQILQVRKVACPLHRLDSNLHHTLHSHALYIWHRLFGRHASEYSSSEHIYLASCACNSIRFMSAIHWENHLAADVNQGF